MSRGHGKIERIILDATTNGLQVTHWGVFQMLPLGFIARTAGYDATKLSVRQSFNRAARNLEEQGHIVRHNHTVKHLEDSGLFPNQYHRTHVLVSPVDYDQSVLYLSAAVDAACLRVTVPEWEWRGEEEPPGPLERLAEITAAQ